MYYPLLSLTSDPGPIEVSAKTAIDFGTNVFCFSFLHDGLLSAKLIRMIEMLFLWPTALMRKDSSPDIAQ